jgi:hypothetical protein
VVLSYSGQAVARPPATPVTTAELHRLIASRLPPAKWRIVEALIESHPRALRKIELAQAVGATVTSSSFQNNLGALRTLGVIDYPRLGEVIARPLLFLE